jgi:ABC-2 type transport system ATP-binding protein
MSTIVEVENLVKQYGNNGGVTAVAGVSFAIRQGEIFSLLGPNGAGKTTTISMLSGLIAPTSGDARVCGRSIVREPLAVKKLIGVVPQEIALYPTLSARQNLLFWGRMYGLSGTALNRRADELLDLVGLRERADDQVSAYSGGMQRRINIAVGLLHEPQIVFMDEPTVGIDPQSRRNILDTIKSLNQRGMTVLYTTHYMNEAEELSDRVGIIDHGRMIALGNQKELTQLVGENMSLRLHLGDGDPAETLAHSLARLPGVVQATATDSQVVVIVPNAATLLPAVMRAADQQEATIRSIDIQEPDLEAVFLHLTGRALRD